MKRLLNFLLVAAVCLMTVSCEGMKYGDVTLEGCRPGGISRINDRNYKVSAFLSLNNRGPQFSAEQITGLVKYKDSALGTFYVEPVTVPKSKSDIEVKGTVLIDASVSLVRLLVISRDFKVDDFKISVNAVCKAGVRKVKFSKNDLPLSSLLKK